MPQRVIVVLKLLVSLVCLFEIIVVMGKYIQSGQGIGMCVDSKSL